MKQHIISLPHHPKRVIIISLIIAITIGTFGYIEINKNASKPAVKENLSINAKEENNSSVSGNLTLGFLASGRIESVSVKAGDVVKKGQILATLDAGNTLGALTQAKAAYSVAQANYQKVINGATGSTIDVAKANVNVAKVNLEQVTNQQNTLVANARRKLYSDGLIAEPDSDTQNGEDPIISGQYSGEEEGDYHLTFKNVDFIDMEYYGLEQGTTPFNTLPQPLGTKGLLVSFPGGKSGHLPNDSWTIHIPNKSGPNYTNNLNAYQLALQTKEQAITSAQATLDQTNATLTLIVTTARPEDVAVAQAQMNNAAGALQIAQAAYENTIITAPSDGTIVSVAIAPGQIAIPSAPAIEFTSSN